MAKKSPPVEEDPVAEEPTEAAYVAEHPQVITNPASETKVEVPPPVIQFLARTVTIKPLPSPFVQSRLQHREALRRYRIRKMLLGR